MYNTIIDPKNGNEIDINSVKGKDILKKYIYQLGGIYTNKKGGAETSGDLVQPTLIFSCPNMNQLADELCLDHQLERGYIGAENAVVDTCDDKENQYAEFNDGWPNLFICNHEKIKNRDVVYLASINSPKELFEQIAVMRAFLNVSILVLEP